jgi:uncharacterized protein (DUF1810 family)
MTNTATTALGRFRSAQDKRWRQITRELATGRKETHWMWFVFPQLRALAKSETAHYYGLDGKAEALAYLDDPILRARLAEATMAVLRHQRSMFSDTDRRKLRACMTLFREITTDPTLPDAVLAKFYAGTRCPLTLDLLAGKPVDVQWTRPAPHRPRPGQWSGSAQGRVMARGDWEGRVEAVRRKIAEQARQATIFDTREPMLPREIEAFLIKHGIGGETVQLITDRWMEDQADAAQQGWDNCEAEQNS